MKTRRLLALVLCFVMLFSDATSTLASTNSGEPIVITDSSELLNSEMIDTEEPETNVTSTEETGEEAVSIETTEVVVPERTEEPVEEPEIATEVEEPTEVAEDTEEIVIEVVEDIKTASTTSLTVGYTDEDDEWIEIGTNPYTSFTDALTGINTFLADPFNGAFSKAVQINMEADATLDCELDLGSDDVPLNLNMNGYTLSVTENRTVRANVWTPNDQSAGTIAVGAGLTLSIKAFDPLGFGMSDDEDWEIEQGQTDVEHTNWQNVVINFDSTNKGDLIIGQEENNGESTTANIRLNDVYINHAKNVTIEGNVGIDGSEVDPATIQFDVAETINVNNKGDNGYVDHYVEILVPTTCKNLVWYTSGTVADLTVSDTVTADIQSDLNVSGQFTVNDIYVEEYGDDPWGYFGMATRHLYQADGTLISAGIITINGQVTCDEALHVPLNFRKHKWAYESESAEWPDHLGVFAYTEGEVIATAPSIDRQLVSLNNEGSDVQLFAARNEQGQLVAAKAVVEVVYNNHETDEFRCMSYGSLEEAVTGMYTEFDGAVGQYTIHLYDDIRLKEDVTLPDFATYVRVEPKYRDVDIFEGDEWVGTYGETTFVNVDFNGHSISVNGSVEWSEAITMTNSAEAEAQLYLCANEECEFRAQSLYTDSEQEQVYVNAAGETVTWPVEQYAFITGVNIDMPNGFVDVRGHENDTTTRIIDAEVIAKGIRIHNGTWKITDLTVLESDNGSYVNMNADLTITGTLTAAGGSFFEVRGKQQIGDIVLKPHSQDPYANLHFQIAKVFGPENRDILSSSGQLTFTGGLTVEEGFAGTPIGVNKKHIILTYMVDENGDIMYEDEEQKYPCMNEEHIWDNMTYENGEVLATIAENSTLTASMFALGEGNSLAIIGDGSLKIGEASVRVHLYIPEEDRSFECGYESLEDAFAKMQADFGGRAGEYTVTLLENTTLTENIGVPDFVTCIRFESAREWVEHFDENGEPIWIYDEAGNEIGIEGHDRITALTLDMNGHSITANCDMEWSELLQIINDSDKASEIYITAEANPGPEGYWPSFRTAWLDENAELVYSDNSKFDFGAEYTWIDNVTIRVPNGRVEFETWDDDGTHIINAELIVSSFKGFDGNWIVADVTIVGSTDGSFIGENAEVTLTGKSTWLAGAGAEVRGTLTFGDIFINANEEEPYANMWVEIVEVYDRDKEDTDEYFIGKGKLTFAGSIETAENFKAGKAVHISKKEVYYYQARDEQGNPLFHDPDGNEPMIWEDQYWDLSFESGETAAYVTDSSVKATQFSTNGNGISFEIVNQELKAYKSAVYVELYIEEEDRGIGFGYKTLEEALENLERDFEGREGSYTFIILEDTELSEDIVLPNFVRNLRLQSEWIWYEHYDENGNPIEIYDEEGNFMGIEGHHDVYVATLDLNGHSISTAGHIEVLEGLHVISDIATKGELVSTSQNGGVSLRQIDNGGLVSATGGAIEVSMDKPFVILDNVDVVAEKAGVDLWSLWGAYTVNGDITARFMNVRGTWTVEDVKVTTDLYLESGWYDEENDYGEPDGYLIADNVSIYNGHMNNSGRLVVKDTFTAKNSGIENYGTLIADKLVVPSGEFHNWEQVSVRDAEIEWFYNHTDVMHFEGDPATPDEDEEHVEEWGALFICDTFKQSDKAFSYMDGSSEFIVNVDAVINNLCTGGFNEEAMNPANITRMAGANLQINEDIYPGDERNIPVSIAIFNKPNDKVAGMGMVEVFDRDEQTGTIYGSWFEPAFVDAEGEKVHEIGGNGWYMYKAKLERGEVLFTTDISNVRTQLVGIDQYVEEGEEAIWETSQDGNKVVAGGYTIFVYSMADGNWQWLRDFKDWSEAVAYIDSLANPNIGYAIELTEDIKLDGPLTLPKNATELVIRGLGDKQIELTCAGDISLSSLVAVTNIKLNASNSTVKLNGFNLIFDEGSIAYIGKAVGTKESILAAFNNSAIMIGKAVTGLAGLEVMWGSRIELGMDNTADASAAKKLQLYSSILVLHDSLTVEEVASWDDLNTVAVKDGASFTITGTVYGPDVTWDEACRQYVGDKEVGMDNTFAITENNPVKAKIRISAINIEKFGRNSNLADGDVLVNAPNVSAAWFVTGSIYEDSIINEETGESIKVRTKIGSLTHKNGDTICYGEGDTTPKAVELRIRDDAMGDFIPYDTYATLAEAFAVIDRIGNAEGFYRIVLMDDVEIATMTTPSKAQALQIWVEEDEEPKKITYDGDMKLNCRLIIANAILAPQSENSKIFVGNYVINLLYGTKLADGCKITGITGSGVAKGSEVILHDNEITISGDIKNVGVLCLQNSVLKVEGTVNVGDVISFEDDGIPEERRLQSTLIGTAKVTRKDGKVTKVEPQITFAGDTWYEQSEIYIALQEKQADGSYKLLDFTAAEMTDVLAAGIPLAKAPKISSMMLLASKENKAAGCITAKDNGYVVARKDVNAVGVTLTFEYPFVRMEWNEEIGDYDYFDDVKIIETYCETVADAATEINNLNTARDYQMRLLPQMTNISSKAPAELKMPNAKAIASLIIMSESAKVDLYYTGKLNFTSDVALINVNFVQTAKDGTAYAQTDTPSPVAISAGGKEMVLANITFNTPIKLDGKKGELYIFGPVVTFTNQESDRAYGSILGDVNGDGTPDITRVCGSITNFTTVDVASNFVLDEYKSGSSYTAPVLNVTALNIASHTVFEMYSYDVKAKATVTELVAANGEFSVEGSATIKKSELSGESWVGAIGKIGKLALTDVTLYDSPMVLSQGELTISGTVTSETDDAVLASFRKSADNQTPGLNIKGKVNLTAPENKIGILVYEYNGSGIPTLTGAPNASGMLLSAKNATPDMFKAGTLPYENTVLDNVGGKGAYTANNINGYVLAKSGSNIYVYYGNEINVELSDAEGNALGYYSSIADATKAVDALKDKNASYTLNLMNRYGDADTPAELKLPKQANSLTIQKNNGKMHIKGKVALSASTALVVGSEAEFAGDVTGKGTFAIGGGVAVTVKGKFDANNLALNGGSVLEGEKVVTIGTIENNGSTQNKIIYGKDAKNVTYLTIKGWVDGTNTNAVLLQMISNDTTKADYVLDSEKGKVILDNTQKIATIEKAALSSFVVMINEETFYMPEGEPRFTYQLVKANKGVYHVDIDTDPDFLGTWLEFTKNEKTYVTCCLDFAQAVNEINTLADKNTDYIINICRRNTTIWDVNLTDKKAVSPITMPKANVANSVTIAYSGAFDWQRGIEFTGNISYAGNLGFVNCEIEAAKISKVKTLTLDNTAFVTTGEVSVNNVVIKGGTTWDAFGKTTIGGLDATEKSVSSYLASKPDKNGVPTFTVSGDVPAETFWKVMKANATADTAVANRYEETYKDRSLVVAKTAGADRFTAYPFADSEPGNNENITNVVAYKDTKNAVKNGNGDDMKVLLSYGGGVTYTKSFEEAVKLIDSIGNKNGRYEIQFLTGGDITTTGVAGSYGKLTLPKKAAWVTISGHLAENGKPATTLQYTGTMKTTVGLIFKNIVLTEGKVSGGTFTPSYAVTPVTSGKNTEINFMGTVSTMKKNNTQTADLVFTSVGGNGIVVIHGGNVDVAGGVAANIFVMNNSGTISVGKDVKVTEMVIADNAAIEAKGKFTAKIVRVLDRVTDEELSAVIDADGAIALTDIYGEDYDDALRIVTNRTAKNESQLTINGQIAGTGVEVAMNVFDSASGEYREMTIADATALLMTEENAAPAKTQKIATAPKASANVYVATYEQVDEAGNKDWVYFGELPSENPDEEPNWITTYKYDGGMYITNLPALLNVYGYSEDSEYYAYFMDWEQAVKEIDKLGNKNAFYDIRLERPVGQNLDGTLNPIKNLTLPSKAAGVGVCGGNIYFTGTKITPKTLTEIYDAGLYAVKAVKEDGMTLYESVTYDVNIGNNMVGFGNIYGWSDGYESKPGTISGSKKGYLAFYRDVENDANETVATMIKGVGTVEFINWYQDTEEPWINYVVTKGISGVQNLILQPYTFLGAYEGDISVKDVYADRADMYAKNITVSGTIEMSDTGLSAGTEKIGDGAIKLKDVVLNGKCGIYGKQDKNGKSLIQITGNVSTGAEYEGDTEGLLQVGLFYNNDSGWVPLSNKLVLLTAPKADASWFIPNYSWEEYEQAVDEETGEPLWDEDGNPVFVQARDEETGELLFDEYGNPIYVVTAVMERMGWERYGYGVYKLGKTIYYGKLAE